MCYLLDLLGLPRELLPLALPLVPGEFPLRARGAKPVPAVLCPAFQPASGAGVVTDGFAVGARALLHALLGATRACVFGPGTLPGQKTLKESICPWG